ncbi:hypothetical protein D9M72_385940 [compost metagenome]
MVVDFVEGVFAAFAFAQECCHAFEDVSFDGFSVLGADVFFYEVVGLDSVYEPYAVVESLPEELAGVLLGFSFGMQRQAWVYFGVFEQHVFYEFCIFFVACDLKSESGIVHFSVVFLVLFV